MAINSIAHPAWECEVGHPVAVEVAELAAAEPELHAAEAVRAGAHARPALDLGGDPLAGAGGDHPAASMNAI